MKLSKLLLLAVTLAFTAVFSVTAMAAVVDLPLEPTWINNDNQKGWHVIGTDGVDVGVTLEQFLGAKKLVVEMDNPPGYIQFTWQGDGDGGKWNQFDDAAQFIDGNTLTIDIPATAVNYDAWTASTEAKFLLAYYDGAWEDLLITRAYIEYDEPAPVSAAELPDGAVALPLTPTWVNNDNQKGWHVIGTDGVEVGVTLEQFLSAKRLVVEMDNPPGYIQFTWSGNSDNWGWNQFDDAAQFINGNTLTIDIPSTAVNYDAWLASTEAKFLLAYYDGPWEDLGITSAYLILGDAPAAPPADEPVSDSVISEDAVDIITMVAGDEYSGANIVIGDNSGVWPYAANSKGTGIAFAPKKDTAYRLTFSATSTGAAGFRVRWISDNDNGSYTSADTEIVNDHVKTSDEVATVIPAYFQGTIESGETKVYTVDFTLDSAQGSDGLIGNIAIRGQQGSNDFIINWITVDEIGGAVLVDKINDYIAPVPLDEPSPEPEPESEPEPTPEPPAPEPAPNPGKNPPTGESGYVTLAIIALLICAAALGTKKVLFDK